MIFINNVNSLMMSKIDLNVIYFVVHNIFLMLRLLTSPLLRFSFSQSARTPLSVGVPK